MWRIRTATNLESEGGVDKDSLNDIREKRNNVVDELLQIIKERPADEVKIQVPFTIPLLI
jgi:hypothetical protein